MGNLSVVSNTGNQQTVAQTHYVSRLLPYPFVCLIERCCIKDFEFWRVVAHDLMYSEVERRMTMNAKSIGPER